MQGFLTEVAVDMVSRLPGVSTLAQYALLAIGTKPDTTSSEVPAGKLPVLGWSAYKSLSCHEVSSKNVMAAALALNATGLMHAGYQYVNLDDCWQLPGRDANGHLAVNSTLFPQGILGLADQIHNTMHMKLGIYSIASYESCGHSGRPGSLGHEETDARDFAAWRVDYLKYDNCHIPSNATDEYVYCAPDGHYMDKQHHQVAINLTSNGTCSKSLNPDLEDRIKFAPPGYDWTKSNSYKRYAAMSKALKSQKRTILFDLCIWGTADVYAWGKTLGQSWRMSRDNTPQWSSITRIININSFHMNSVEFYAHNDADLLQVGQGNLTAAETRSHFALWAVMKSPLLISGNVSTLTTDELDLLKNDHLLAFNQDEVFGGPATPFKWDWQFDMAHPAGYWSGRSQRGILILMLNTGDETALMQVTWDEVPGLECVGNCSYLVTDIWNPPGTLPVCVKTGLAPNVATHDTAGYLISNPC